MPEDESEKLELFPECSGDPLNCPENEGHGCCDLINRQIAQKNRQHEALKLENAELLLKCVLLEEELATLRAKAKAYDEGETAACIFCPDGKLVLARINAILAWDDLEVIKMDIKRDLRKQGYTCSKVRVCREVES